MYDTQYDFVLIFKRRWYISENTEHHKNISINPKSIMYLYTFKYSQFLKRNPLILICVSISYSTIR